MGRIRKSALPICNYSQILYQFLTFTQNLKRSPEILLFAISRPFMKANLKISAISPAIEDVIITTTIPKSVKTYIDREWALDAINALLEEHSTLFLHGIPGIGKSELIKAYCKAHKKDYTNIMFLEYTGSLYEMIADMEFVDDSDTLTEKERFRRHFRFLKTLKNDKSIFTHCIILSIYTFNLLKTLRHILMHYASLNFSISGKIIFTYNSIL